jgi:hypothetical protein
MLMWVRENVRLANDFDTDVEESSQPIELGPVRFKADSKQANAKGKWIFVH